eukprot:TRINITY_DN91413_c0_g1_i1.p1 TRINITY_DN91413_c0_g1~~TRINITY_DN91413_c0_g1_i1.p1  ORF type:complete len:515 (+),score=106.69 TRINITY_DN91413_c0_g1_i1:33-1577(+)
MMADPATPIRRRGRLVRHESDDKGIAVDSTAVGGLPEKQGLCPATDESLAWLRQHSNLIGEAENQIIARWSDPTLFDEGMPLCDEVMEVMKTVLSSSSDAAAAQSKSVLLLGEAGSGKTQAVEWCLNKLQGEHASLVVLRARGDAYSTNVECLRHLAAQVAGQLASVPTQTGSFEDSMEWFRRVLRESFKRDSAVVMVLDKFEHFCGLARQTLLYNLFNLAQDLNMRLCIVGISDKFNVTGSLEKRIMSRFSMQHLYAFLPEEMDHLLQILGRKLHLPETSSLGAAFAQQLNAHVAAALKLRSQHWGEFLELGRKPSWFLWQCLPLASLLQPPAGAAALRSGKRAGASAAGLDALGKKPRGCLAKPCTGMQDVRELLVSGLAECEHLVLLGFFKQHERSSRQVRTLSIVLYELLNLVDTCGGVLAYHTEDSLCAAFDRLLSQQLLRFCAAGPSGVCNAPAAAETPRRYLPVDSMVDKIYAELVADLERTEPTRNNPLRSLPQQVQQWAVTRSVS